MELHHKIISGYGRGALGGAVRIRLGFWKMLRGGLKLMLLQGFGPDFVVSDVLFLWYGVSLPLVRGYFLLPLVLLLWSGVTAIKLRSI